MESVDVFNKRREKLGYTKERGNLDKNEYSISVHVWLLDVPTINPSYNLLKNYYDLYMKGKIFMQ